MDPVEVSMAEAKGETKTAAAPPQAPEPAAAPAPAPRRALPAVAALLVGLSVGGGVGIVAGGTLLAAWRSGALESKAEAHGGGEHHGGGERVVYVDASQTVVHTIDALVVNPADSEATRFLMATLVVVADRVAVVDQLKERDAEAREVILRTLGAKTVAELSDLGKRDELKEELRRALLGVVDAGRILRIHLPQFVIQ